MQRFSQIWPGAPLAIASAALFGASTPFAKLLLGEGTKPWLLAGLLYLGSGVGLGLIQLVRILLGTSHTDAPLTRADLPWLALIVLTGGIAGPVLLMVALASAAASSAALLLNLEGLATMAIAWIVFRENVDRRLIVGAFAILAGALLLSWQGGPTGLGFGAFAIAGACLAWGRDARRALRPGGLLTIWSAAPDLAFKRRLGQAGFAVDEMTARAHKGRGGRYVIWIPNERELSPQPHGGLIQFMLLASVRLDGFVQLIEVNRTRGRAQGSVLPKPNDFVGKPTSQQGGYDGSV